MPNQLDLLDEILRHLDEIRGDYAALNQHRHQKDIDKLIVKLTEIKHSTQIDNKFSSAIELLEETFSKEEKQFRKPFLGIGKEKNAKDFIDHINNKENTHHYSRMLALLLEAIYIEHADKLNSPRKVDIQVIHAIQLPDHPIYAKRLANFITEENKPQIEIIKSATPKKLTPVQLYRLYKDPDNFLTVQMAKKLWPDLTNKYGLKDSEINEFIKLNLNDKSKLNIFYQKATLISGGYQSVLADALPGLQSPTKKINEEQTVNRIREGLQKILNEIGNFKNIFNDVKGMKSSLNP